MVCVKSADEAGYAQIATAGGFEVKIDERTSSGEFRYGTAPD